MRLISPSRFPAAFLASDPAQVINRARGIRAGARPERVFGFRFEQCPDFEKNSRNPVFVQKHE